MERQENDTPEVGGGYAASAITLLELNRRVGQLVCVPETTSVWVTGEISDFSNRRHIYMELVQKDGSGETVARARATIWANTFFRLDAKFTAATGSHLASGQKVMFLVSAGFHPVYGFSLNITDVNPEFTLGDMFLRRRQNIERLTREGIIDMNMTLQWSATPMNLAVISSETAAGYGDFCRHLLDNSRRLKFSITLFPALMQGSQAPESIISALEQVAAGADGYDGVVIIRGGGATDDLSCFEDYDLAANIAQFPLPVIIGIGHERDITLLDYVANMRVKTPTAAAAWLIERASAALDRALSLYDSICRRAREIISENNVFLSQAELLLRTNSRRIIDSHKGRIAMLATRLHAAASGRITREESRLGSVVMMLENAARTRLERASAGIDTFSRVLEAVSPEAVLSRGYTITTFNGRSGFNPSDLKKGDIIQTRFANTIINSTVNEKN